MLMRTTVTGTLSALDSFSPRVAPDHGTAPIAVNMQVSRVRGVPASRFYAAPGTIRAPRRRAARWDRYQEAPAA